MVACLVVQGNCFLQVGGLPMVQLVRILRARLNLALNQLRSARRDIKAILAADPNSLQVRLPSALGSHAIITTTAHCCKPRELSNTCTGQNA